MNQNIKPISNALFVMLKAHLHGARTLDNSLLLPEPRRKHFKFWAEIFMIHVHDLFYALVVSTCIIALILGALALRVDLGAMHVFPLLVTASILILLAAGGVIPDFLSIEHSMSPYLYSLIYQRGKYEPFWRKQDTLLVIVKYAVSLIVPAILMVSFVSVLPFLRDTLDWNLLGPVALAWLIIFTMNIFTIFGSLIRSVIDSMELASFVQEHHIVVKKRYTPDDIVCDIFTVDESANLST